VLDHEELMMASAISSRRRDQRQPFMRVRPVLTAPWSLTPASPAGCQNTWLRLEKTGSTKQLDPPAPNAHFMRGRKQDRPAWRPTNRMSGNLRPRLHRAAKADIAPTKNSGACVLLAAMSPFLKATSVVEPAFSIAPVGRGTWLVCRVPLSFSNIGRNEIAGSRSAAQIGPIEIFVATKTC
jgi:hypothetical protein